MALIPQIVIDNAACRGMDTDKEFYSYLTSSKNPKETVPLPKDHVCFRCPVMEECREHGLYHQLYGTWGGMTEYELAMERKRRRIPPPSSGIGNLARRERVV